MLDAAALPLLTFAAAAGVLTLTPGVDTVTVLRSAAAGGPRSGMAAAFGICGGLFVWGAGAAFGLTALLATSQTAFTGLKWVGAAYLVMLGVRQIWNPRRSLDTRGSEAKPAGRRVDGDALRRGFLTNMLNPKVGIFYITFLPQFIPPSVDVAAFTLLLATIHMVLGIVWSAVLVALTVPLGRVLARPRVVGAFDRATGCIFVAFGAKLAIAHRP